MSAFSQGRGHERHLHGCQNHEGCRRRKHFVENSKEVLLCNLGFISRKSRKSKHIWEELFRTSRRSSSPPFPVSLALCLLPRSHTHMHTHCPMELPPFDLSPLPLTHTLAHKQTHCPTELLPNSTLQGLTDNEQNPLHQPCFCSIICLHSGLDRPTEEKGL